jgi:hypothetical protein
MIWSTSTLLRLGGRVCGRLVDVQGRGVALGRDREVGSADRATGQPERVEGLRAGHVVRQVKAGLALGGRAPDDLVGSDLLCPC